MSVDRGVETGKQGRGSGTRGPETAVCRCSSDWRQPFERRAGESPMRGHVPQRQDLERKKSKCRSTIVKKISQETKPNNTLGAHEALYALLGCNFWLMNASVAYTRQKAHEVVPCASWSRAPCNKHATVCAVRVQTRERRWCAIDNPPEEMRTLNAQGVNWSEWSTDNKHRQTLVIYTGRLSGGRQPSASKGVIIDVGKHRGMNRSQKQSVDDRRRRGIVFTVVC